MKDAMKDALYFVFALLVAICTVLAIAQAVDSGKGREIFSTRVQALSF